MPAASPSSVLPLRPGASGDAVRDVQRRLARLGFLTTGDPVGGYGVATEAAVRAFQERRGLRVDGLCGADTWASLVEAGYRLGDRFLYLRSPMVRGDDVADLQRQLSTLGFNAGRVDGIFGSQTADALLDFQRNTGLTVDGIFGPDALVALRRLGDRQASGTTVALVREEERLRAAPRYLTGRRIAVGEAGGLGALADALGRALLDAGAVVLVVHHPDESEQAAEANEFDAAAFLGVAVSETAGCGAAYYSAAGFESIGGRRLASLVVEAAGGIVGSAGAARGMRLPLLRETRMPAVLCELGPPGTVVERTAALADALRGAVERWVLDPLDP